MNMDKDRQLESFEEVLKPTKKHRGVLLILYFAIVILQGFLSYRLYCDVESFNVTPTMEYES